MSTHSPEPGSSSQDLPGELKGSCCSPGHLEQRNFTGMAHTGSQQGLKGAQGAAGATSLPQLRAQQGVLTALEIQERPHRLSGHCQGTSSGISSGIAGLSPCPSHSHVLHSPGSKRRTLPSLERRQKERKVMFYRSLIVKKNLC